MQLLLIDFVIDWSLTFARKEKELQNIEFAKKTAVRQKATTLEKCCNKLLWLFSFPESGNWIWSQAFALKEWVELDQCNHGSLKFSEWCLQSLHGIDTQHLNVFCVFIWHCSYSAVLQWSTATVLSDTLVDEARARPWFTRRDLNT